MKTKLLLFCVFAFISFAQVIDKKWAIIQDLEDRIVYIDTSTLKMMNNQISVWTNIYYREPIELSPFQPKARSVRSQFLINPVTRKFQVIGSIYYDDKGAMVSESSSSRFGIGNFQSNVDEVSGMEIVLNKSQEFLNSGSVSSEPSQVDFTIKQEDLKENVINPTAKKDSVDSQKSSIANSRSDEFYRINKSGKVVYTTLPDISKVADNRQVDNTQIKFEDTNTAVPEKDSLETNNESTEPFSTNNIDELIPQQNPPEIINPPTPEISSNTTEGNPTKKESEIIESEYNIDNESNVTPTIFSDGNLFVVQVSSWKTASVAKNELVKLEAKGYNAFIHEVYINSKRATYNRVRVGFFNSLNEAKEIERKIKSGN